MMSILLLHCGVFGMFSCSRVVVDDMYFNVLMVKSGYWFNVATFRFYTIVWSGTHECIPRETMV